MCFPFSSSKQALKNLGWWLGRFEVDPNGQPPGSLTTEQDQVVLCTSLYTELMVLHLWSSVNNMESLPIMPSKAKPPGRPERKPPDLFRALTHLILIRML